MASMVYSAKDFDSPKIDKFLAYWRSKCRDGRLPSHADIDPTEIPELLSVISIIEVVGEGDDARFRFRLFGTAHVEHNRADFTGSFLDEVFEKDDADAIAETYRRVVETGEPHFWRSHFRQPGLEFRKYRRLMLPLASDGKKIDMLIGIFEFESEQGAG